MNLWNPSGSADKDYVVDVSLIHLRISERLFHWLQSAAEEVGAEIFKAGASDRSIEIDSFKQRIDLDADKEKGRFV